jgi:DNA polymerase III epsilon subunit-like protein
MVFDTETTGLPLKKTETNDQPKIPTKKVKPRELNSLVDLKTPEQYPILYPDIVCLEKQPYLTQLSFLVLDNNFNVVFSYNEYIKLPDHVEISALVTNITGITTEKCRSHGVDPCEALKAFCDWFLQCDRIVAHNIQFDRTIIRFEIARHYHELVKVYPYIKIIFTNIYDRVFQLDHFDTMIRGNKICGIMIPKKSGEGTKLKLPKLVEMYQILFHKTPDHLHNSMVDVLVTMRCYLKLLREHRDIDDTYFEQLLENAVNNGNMNGHLVEFA